MQRDIKKYLGTTHYKFCFRDIDNVTGDEFEVYEDTNTGERYQLVVRPM